MKTVGIIAEYNPFHNGHAYQLRELKKRTGADYIVIAMSGDYVQRGEPALVDKYARTQMALENGADLVLELPVQWATSSAERFAQGGVELLAATGVVDFLGFGAEDDSLLLMKELAQILVDEPESYRAALGEALRSGVNFPTARMQALSYYLTDKDLTNFSNSSTLSDTRYGEYNRIMLLTDNTESANYANAARKSSSDKTQLLLDLLSRPNNILALEYLKALRHGDYSMKPILIPRVGDGYHEEDTRSEYASATAIRKRILSDTRNISNDSHTIPTGTATSDCKSILNMGTSAESLAINYSDFLRTYLPASCADILSQYQSASRFLCADDFSQILGYRLLTLRETGYDAYADISPELSSRIRHHVDEYQSFTQFCELLKTKELTYTRICRALLHLILDIQDDRTSVPYLRILGFRRVAKPLLHAMKQHATLPIITKMADAPRILNPTTQEFLRKEIFVSDLYAQIAQHNNVAKAQATNEVNHGLVII